MSRELATLEHYRTLSEAMLDAAQDERWDELVRLGDERGTLAAATEAPRWPAAEQAPARTLVDRCQALDRAIRSLVEERQKDLRVLLRVTDPVT